MSFLREASAIGRKEILLDLRFAFQYFLQSISSPLTRLIPLFFIYTAVLRDASSSLLPGVTRDTYIPFLLLGTLFHTVWTSSTTIFAEKFLREKYWQTADLLFLAPVRTSAMIAGAGLSVVTGLLPTLLFFLGSLFVVLPPTLGGFLLTLLALFLTLGLALCAGLMLGSTVLANENAIPFFHYGIAGVALLSAFFYPFETLQVLPEPLPSLLIPLVRYNPLYAGVNFARAAWYGTGPLPWTGLLYLMVAFFIMIPIATNTFRTVWRKFGVQG